MPGTEGAAGALSPETPEEAIRAYKQVLSGVLDQRPSGTRQRLADALGKHRSFVSQITSPSYATPIPARHIAAIFSVCHFGPAERERFLSAYAVAHPGKAPPVDAPRTRHLSLTVPDLGDDRQNAAFDRALAEFIQKLGGLMGKGR